MASLLFVEKYVPSAFVRSNIKWDILEIVLSALSLAADLDPHLDTSVHLLCSALVIDAELNDITVLDAILSVGQVVCRND